MTPDKISKNFSRCRDWQERYLYLIELGERYATLEQDQQIESNRVSGCQSQVWVVITHTQLGVAINANSDSSIVKGLLALLIVAYQEKSYPEAIAFDIGKWFEQLELNDHLTPTRTMGLNAIVVNIKQQLEDRS